MIKTVSKCLWCESEDLSLFTRRKDKVRILSCNDCGLYMVGEVPDDLDEYYYQETYYNASETNIDTGYAEIYDLMAPAFLLWQNSLIEEVNESHPKKSLLEIGCATGNLLEIIRESQENLDLEGIDISEYAVMAAREKGFNAKVALIEEYVADPKKDIIFSAETLEHLDDLKSFLGGVKRNLKDDGTFLFYVPSISAVDASKDKDHYVRFNTNLEHLLHFTPEFFNKELPNFFDSHVLIKEFKTGFGPCIVGAVSKKASNLSDLKQMFSTLETEQIPPKSSPIFLKNLVIMSLKFAQFELADGALTQLEASGEFDDKIKLLLNGLRGYHNGELEKSNKAFEEYLKLSPGSALPIRSLLSNEREMRRLTREELYSLKQEKLELIKKGDAVKNELRELKESRIVNAALKLRRVRRGVLNRAPKVKKKIRGGIKRVALVAIPARLRPKVMYAISREWMVKHIWVDNQKLKKDQPILSIVIPYYNRSDTIVETLDSLRGQTFIGFEVIIVDDGSTKSQNIHTVEKKEFRDLNITIVEQDNQGVAAARNKGISKAKGKYIMCLDSDDFIEPTCIEKFLVILETHPDIDLVGSDMRHFGLNNFVYKEGVYDPFRLIENNMLITSTMFTRESWDVTGGYKSAVGYEDWEFWISLAENGYWGMNIPEPLLNYRTSASSRYVDDKLAHKKNMKKIIKLHPQYMQRIRRIFRQKKFNRRHINTESLFLNLGESRSYKMPDNPNKNVLITVPWMTFGGAETLIYNFCRETKNDFNVSFITGLLSDHEWEYKFREISPNIYHLPHFSDDKNFYVEFISHYIETRKIDILHIIHNGFMFEMLPELKKRHPKLKVIVTVFNDRAPYCEDSIGFENYIDRYTADNQAVTGKYHSRLNDTKKITLIPNGINAYEEYNQAIHDRASMRKELRISEEDIAVFFVGRLSEEKNPDVFLKAAAKLVGGKDSKLTRFFMIGDGPMKPEIDALLKKHKSERITHLGYQSEVAKYLCAADIFVLPSSIEGFPLSILEAMALEVVPIASRVGGVPEIIEEGVDGFMVTAGSVDEIAQTILNLERDQKLLKTMKSRVRQKIEKKYSNRILGANYRKMYKETLK